MRSRLVLVVVCLALIAAPTAAHEKFKIVGTVLKIHAAQLDVKAIDGATYEIDTTDATVVTRKFKTVPKGELKTGAKVIVHALGHDMFDLEAVEVQLVN